MPWFYWENNKAIFTLNGGTNEDDIWVSDGTDIGTTVLKDLNYFIKRTPYSVIKWREHAYVLANDVDDLLLVKTDGTVENTTTIGTFYKQVRVEAVNIRVLFSKRPHRSL